MKYYSGKNYNNYEKKLSGSQKKQVFIMLIVLSLSIIFMKVLFQFIIIPSLKISHIELISDLDSDLTKLISNDLKKLLNGMIYFSVDEEIISTHINKNNNIKNFFVEKKFPNTVKIVIKSRNPVLALSEKLYIDEDGVIFQKNSRNKNYIPVLEIDDTDNIDINSIYFLKNLEQLKKNEPNYFEIIRGFRFIYDESKHLKIFLYIKGFDIPFLISKNITGEMIKNTMICSEIFLKKEELLDKIEFFDFRANNIVYTLKK